MSESAEQQLRDGAPPNDGPFGGAPGPSAETDRLAEGEAPSGLPNEDHEATPLGTTDERPEGERDPERGAEAQPGIPTGGEPPTAG